MAGGVVVIADEYYTLTLNRCGCLRRIGVAGGVVVIAEWAWLGCGCCSRMGIAGVWLP